MSGVLDGTAKWINHFDDHRGVCAPRGEPDASPRTFIVSAFGIIESAGEPEFPIGPSSAARRSPGRDNCYAETFAERFRGVKGHPYEQRFDLRLVREKPAEPLRLTKPKMIFVNSMSDLFRKDVADDDAMLVAEVMRVANWHTYQCLTKRSGRLAAMRAQTSAISPDSHRSGAARASRTAATACCASITCAMLRPP
jgi:hypothetical protein